nr:MAG TPA: hypothetical protein [Inoviridae sp.]
MVGGVFPQCLGTSGNPATQDSQYDARNSDENKDKKNRLSFIKIKKIAHPSNHRGEKFTDLREQGSNSRGRSLKTSSFHKNLWAPVTDGAGEPTKRKRQRKQ